MIYINEASYRNLFGNIQPRDIPLLLAPLLAQKPRLQEELSGEVARRMGQYRAVVLKMGVPDVHWRAQWSSMASTEPFNRVIKLPVYYL